MVRAAQENYPDSRLHFEQALTALLALVPEACRSAPWYPALTRLQTEVMSCSAKSETAGRVQDSQAGKTCGDRADTPITEAGAPWLHKAELTALQALPQGSGMTGRG